MKTVELRIQIKIEDYYNGDYHLEKAIDGIRNAGLNDEIINYEVVNL